MVSIRLKIHSENMKHITRRTTLSAFAEVDGATILLPVSDEFFTGLASWREHGKGVQAGRRVALKAQTPRTRGIYATDRGAEKSQIRDQERRGDQAGSDA